MAKFDTVNTTDNIRLLATVAWLVIFVFWPKITLSVTLLLIGGAFIAYNAMIFRTTVIHKAEASSAAPIVGGIITAAGILLLPPTGSWKWAWIPLVIDWGGIPMFVYWYAKQLKS